MAVISQIKTSISIYIPDETLHSILPQGKISFNLQDGVQVNTPELKPAQDLIVTVLGVIEEKCSEVSILRKKRE